MAKLTKNNAMLVDIQYVKPNHRAGKKDYLYIIWKDLDTMEKTSPGSNLSKKA